jgi:hypothetical protein
MAGEMSVLRALQNDSEAKSESVHNDGKKREFK